jgi:hypothetical protein
MKNAKYKDANMLLLIRLLAILISLEDNALGHLNTSLI